jgi:hypothetical protein
MTIDVHSTDRTSLKGYLCGPTYANLVELFGDPITKDLCDPWKTRAEWHVDTPDGLVTIYDYRNKRPIAKVTYWHLGGHNQASVGHVMRTIGAAPSTRHESPLAPTYEL